MQVRPGLGEPMKKAYLLLDEASKFEGLESSGDVPTFVESHDQEDLATWIEFRSEPVSAIGSETATGVQFETLIGKRATPALQFATAKGGAVLSIPRKTLEQNPTWQLAVVVLSGGEFHLARFDHVQMMERKGVLANVGTNGLELVDQLR